ncbi:helix-turn-helix domain-containing protein [Cohnella phaseoli]|uniref:ABC-type Fe3+-hydroxamate transport system substrate-binding protein n=1 Tax=Cohnella phaseoli TaxID=456490 RepID=A0A3D9KFA4_9BACL|nr:helix-turn-helix domain-containing protein [Cohnella phaseoli]RED85202.1 ABC-type Fe3+-hydroxamate transport system substrate-binding protein [Cohnella phaseoli]
MSLLKHADSDAAADSVRSSLEKIREYVAEHYDEPLTLEQLAGMTSLSPKYFGELFKKQFGQSVTDYVTEVRISQAKRYLRDTDGLLRDIARKVGYADEFYFSRKFKKEVGVPPSAYTRSATRRIAALSPSSVGYLLALGIVPVAAPIDAKWTPYYYHTYYSRISIHLKQGEMDATDADNALLRGRPDAVIGYEQPRSPRLLAALERRSLPLFVPDRQLGWEVQLRQIAEFLDAQGRCEAWITAYRRKAEQARELVGQAVGRDTFVVLRLCGNNFYLYCNRGIRDVVYHDLQLRAACLKADVYNEKISLRQLKSLNPDRILLLVCPDDETRTAWLALQHSAEWRTLAAVSGGRVYSIPSDPWFEYSAFSINRMLNEMLMMFTGKCPNDDLEYVHGDGRRSEL